MLELILLCVIHGSIVQLNMVVIAFQFISCEPLIPKTLHTTLGPWDLSNTSAKIHAVPGSQDNRAIDKTVTLRFLPFIVVYVKYYLHTLSNI